MSFEEPEYTANADGLGALRILEAIRILGLQHKTRFYQASTSELYGLVQQIPQSETTPFYPRSPYAVAKLFAYWTTVNYREAYGHLCLQRDSVQSRIAGAWRDLRDAQDHARHGAHRGGSAEDVVSRQSVGVARLGPCARLRGDAMAMLQQERPEDYVIATGVQYSVREFVQHAAAELGVTVRFEGDRRG